MTCLAIPYAHLSKLKESIKQEQYASLYSILDIASNSIFKPESYSNFEDGVGIINPANNARVRNLKKNCSYRRICLYPSAKNKKMIQCESNIERKLVHLLEFHPEIVSYKEQPCIIKWIDKDGFNHKHIPDFRIEFKNGNIIFIEVKPDKALNDISIGQRTEIIGKGIAAKYGFQYLLIVESQLDKVSLTNADILRCFPKDEIPAFEVEYLRKIFKSAHVPISIDTLVENESIRAQDHTMDYIKNLIRRGVLVFDMTSQFNQKTPLRWVESSSK